MIVSQYYFKRYFDMRKVLLNMNEQQKYEIIKSLVEHNGNKNRAALKLGCTKHPVNRRFKNTNHMAKLPSSMATRDASLHTPFRMQRKAYFDEQETLNGYYNVLHQILTQHGIPAMFYTDHRTVFEFKKKKSNQIEHDTFTQFSYACHQLGVELKTTSVAQAKGRVEKNYYKTMDANGLQTHFHRGTKGLVIKTFDGQLLFSTNEQVYELELVPEHKKHWLTPVLIIISFEDIFKSA